MKRKTARSMLIACGTLALACASTLAERGSDGLWKAEAVVASSDQRVEFWLFLRTDKGRLTAAADLDFGFARMIGYNRALVGAPVPHAAFENGVLRWKLPIPGREFSCRATLAEDAFKGVCQREGAEMPVTLRRQSSNPLLCDDFSGQLSSPRQKHFVEAGVAAVKALAYRDHALFRSLFAPSAATHSSELLESAFGVYGKPPFGLVPLMSRWGRLGAKGAKKAARVEVSEFDGEGAFLKVTFENEYQEFFIQVDEGGKITELSYVPPPGGSYRIK